MKTYWKAKSILTENERVFYRILAERLASEHILLCKVRMEDVIHVDFNLKNKDFSAYQSARGKIKNRHFDFVICDAKTQEIQRIIELDGGTHRKDSEAEADKFKDEACREAGLKIIRIDYQEMNYPETMLQKIVEG